MMISVCMIVRNEVKVLARAVASTEGLADEVVVHDTGSDDGTVAEALRLGCKVVPNGDRNHLGRARNRAIEAAGGDWIVILDADEVIAEPVAVRDFLLTTEADGVMVRVVFLDMGKETLSYHQMRCWQRGTYWYKYRAHEVPLAVRGCQETQTEFVWEHRRPAGRTWKADYLLALLELDVKENPGDRRPVFYLARQYVYAREWNAAIDLFDEYLRAPDHDEGEAWAYLAQCYEALEQRKEQIVALHRACVAQPGRRDFWGRLAGVYFTGEKYEVAAGLLKLALELPRPQDVYVVEWWYGAEIYDFLARCLWKLGRYDEGYRYELMALGLDRENERFEANARCFREKLKLAEPQVPGTGIIGNE